MIQAATIKFLKDLQKNNNRPWFEKNRNHYENAKADFLLMVEQLIKAIATFDKPIGNLEAKNCTFRINRDVRFSKNKDPYKNNMAAYFNKDGKKGLGAGYYLHIEPGKSFAAGGIWMPEPAILTAIRQEIDYDFKTWKNIVGSNSFKKTFPAGIQGENLTRPPKGYDENNPAIEFIKKKSFIVTRNFTDAEIQNKNLVKEVTKTFRAMKALIDFLNLAIE
ncbi:MAG: DUF2461 domain-containing protein [Ferruginibacter sp.]|nr:DUF2461 domain-containing protein [Ferruginibacter sp.]